jgi:hypothetical protein
MFATATEFACAKLPQKSKAAAVIGMIAIPSLGLRPFFPIADSAIVKSYSAYKQALVTQSCVKPRRGSAALVVGREALRVHP